MDFRIKRDDLLPAITITCLNADGTVVDLTDATSPRFIMRRAGEAAKVDATATILSPATGGQLRYPWSGTDTDTAGNYLGEFEVHFGASPATFPTDGYLEIEVFPDLDGTLPTATTATPPGTCVISGAVYSAGNAPFVNALVRIRISPGLDAAAGTGYHTSEPQTTYTAIDGSWSLTLPQGEDFRVEIPACGLDAIGTVPTTSTAEFSSITLDAYRGSAPPAPYVRWA